MGTAPTTSDNSVGRDSHSATPASAYTANRRGRRRFFTKLMRRSGSGARSVGPARAKHGREVTFERAGERGTGLDRQAIRPEKQREVGEVERLDLALDAVPESRAEAHFRHTPHSLPLLLF